MDSDGSDSVRFRIMDLPRELRDRIYEFMVVKRNINIVSTIPFLKPSADTTQFIQDIHLDDGVE